MMGVCLICQTKNSEKLGGLKRKVSNMKVCNHCNVKKNSAAVLQSYEPWM